jgi:peptidoglycan/xylan/chitin deacetylase (PgdA/CDA1 family)
MASIPVREHLRAAYAYGLDRAGVVERSRLALADRALVLMYHRVLDEPGDDVKPGMYVTRAAFERHLAYLSSRHEVIGLAELGEWMAGRRSFARIPCVITFDDGWLDNFTNAFPLLRRYGLTATVFLITEQLGSQDMLTWDQAREMEAEGIDFGSHTATHPVLTTLADAAVRDELSRSRDRLHRELRRPSQWFCYPKGAFSDGVLEVARELYAGAVSTIRGAVRHDDDRFRLPRVGIHDDVTRTTSLFACRLVSLV